MSWALPEESPQRKTREEQLAEVSKATRREARTMLESPELITWICRGIELCGVAGESQTALLVYLTGTSRLLEKPLAVIIQGPSSSGKSYVLEQVTRQFPAAAVLHATDITDNALYYMPKGELSHRFVLAGERPRGLKEESGQGTKALREMISSGKLSKVVTISTPDGHETKIIDQSGPIAYAESTTANNLFEEDVNRCLILSMSEEDTSKRIMDCCCGSGRMLLACADINPRNEFFGQDVDHCCVQMTAINLALRGLYGWVIHGNSLTLEQRRVYRTGFNGHGFIRAVEPQAAPEPVKAVLESPPPPPGKQLTLF